MCRPPLGQGVSRHARQCGLGRGQPGEGEVRVEVRSSRSVDRRPQGPCLLCLCHQLSDRPRPCRHRRCRAQPSHPATGGRRHAHDDRSHPGSLRALSQAASCRQRFWRGREPCLAGPGAGHRAHIPVFDKSHRQDGTFERVDFTFDHENDTYTCPAGKQLRQRRGTSALRVRR